MHNNTNWIGQCCFIRERVAERFFSICISILYFILLKRNLHCMTSFKQFVSKTNVDWYSEKEYYVISFFLYVSLFLCVYVRMRVRLRMCRQSIDSRNLVCQFAGSHTIIDALNELCVSHVKPNNSLNWIDWYDITHENPQLTTLVSITICCIVLFDVIFFCFFSNQENPKCIRQKQGVRHTWLFFSFLTYSMWSRFWEGKKIRKINEKIFCFVCIIRSIKHNFVW